MSKNHPEGRGQDVDEQDIIEQDDASSEVATGVGVMAQPEREIEDEDETEEGRTRPDPVEEVQQPIPF